jgi:glycerophosphodiester phosphodiesterase
MRYTRNYKLNKDKGNQPGTIQGPFTTLEQVLRQVPVNVGFNIECKYPMIDECEREEMEFLNVELNWWVDTGICTSALSLTNGSVESRVR